MATQFANGKIVTDGLVLALDAADRNSYISGSLVWNDVSGNGYTSSLTNGPIYNNSNGGVILFDGVDDSVTTTLITSDLGLTSSNGATISSWMKLKVQSTYKGITGFIFGFNGVNFGIDIENNNNIRVWKSETAYTTPVNILAYDSIWALYTVVSSNSSFQLYINNNLLHTNVAATGNINSRANGFLKLMNSWDGTISGSLANVDIYNRALNSTEVLQNYNAQKSRFGLK
jgi:hypothetical protein